MLMCEIKINSIPVFIVLPCKRKYTPKQFSRTVIPIKSVLSIYEEREIKST